MTAKKQIIIDGVNISECKSLIDGRNHFAYEDEFYCAAENKGTFWNGITYYHLCQDCPNCYFKQLARKTQECEELKDLTYRLENQRETYYKEFLRIKSALEEIEKIVGECPAFDYNAKQIFSTINKAKENQ